MNIALNNFINVVENFLINFDERDYGYQSNIHSPGGGLPTTLFYNDPKGMQSGRFHSPEEKEDRLKADIFRNVIKPKLEKYWMQEDRRLNEGLKPVEVIKALTDALQEWNVMTAFIGRRDDEGRVYMGRVSDKELTRMAKQTEHALKLSKTLGRANYPEVICLVGSTKFKDAYRAMEKEFALQGKVVLSVGCFGHQDSDVRIQEKKIMLDNLHLRKIELADRVYVINVDGYIGDSTRSEIGYAKEIGKPVSYLEEIEEKVNGQAGS